MKVIRACIYPKDIQRITGRSERCGRKLLNDIKAHFGKKSYNLSQQKNSLNIAVLKKKL